MTIATIRKALVAAVATALSAYVTAWAQTDGSLPGWATVGAALSLGVVAGLTTWGVPNARVLPKSAVHLAGADVTPAARAAMRTAARQSREIR